MEAEKKREAWTDVVPSWLSLEAQFWINWVQGQSSLSEILNGWASTGVICVASLSLPLSQSLLWRQERNIERSAFQKNEEALRAFKSITCSSSIFACFLSGKLESCRSFFFSFFHELVQIYIPGLWNSDLWKRLPKITYYRDLHISRF